jgi:hypothetical protein
VDGQFEQYLAKLRKQTLPAMAEGVPVVWEKSAMAEGVPLVGERESAMAEGCGRESRRWRKGCQWWGREFYVI